MSGSASCYSIHFKGSVVLPGQVTAPKSATGHMRKRWAQVEKRTNETINLNMKRIKNFVILLFGFVTLGFSQRLIETDSTIYIEIGELRLDFVILDTIMIDSTGLLDAPKYSLGEKQLEKYLISSLRFPDEFLEDTTINLVGFETEAIASFVIDKMGNIKDTKIIKGFHHSSDKDIINALNKLQKFEPAKYDNRPVEISLILKLKYKA